MPFPGEAIDFLGLAACWGLSVYVTEMFDAKEEHLDKTYATYLLCCSVWALKRNDWWPQYDDWKSGTSRLMAELLKRGANPNFNLEHLSTTIWGSFLNISPTSITPKAVKTFLETGADVNVKALHYTKINVYSCLKGFGAQVFCKADKIPDLYLREEKTPLFIIRQWISTKPRFVSEIKVLESMIESKGGKDSQRFTRVASCTSTSTYPVQKLTHRQHDSILAALNEANCGQGLRDRNNLEWRRCLEKICRQISQMYGESDHGTSANEDPTSDTEIFYDSMDIQTVVDKQDEISARFFPELARPKPSWALIRHYYT